MATITITVVAPGINETGSLTISDGDAATILAAHAVLYPGTSKQTLLGMRQNVFSQIVGVANAYKAQQVLAAVVNVQSVIT